MKRLLKKRVLIPLVVVVALAIGGAAAYAAFSASASTVPYNVSTGTATISLGLVGPEWSLANLVPASGPSSSNAQTETIAVTNSGQTNLDMALTATFNNIQASDGSYLGDVLDLQIVGPHNSWSGTFDQLNSFDLGTWGQGTANVTLTVWLNSGAGNAWQGWSGEPITFNFNGTQIVQ
jgi:hypothetical protein